MCALLTEPARCPKIQISFENIVDKVIPRLEIFCVILVLGVSIDVTIIFCASVNIPLEQGLKLYSDVATEGKFPVARKLILSTFHSVAFKNRLIVPVFSL